MWAVVILSEQLLTVSAVPPITIIFIQDMGFLDSSASTAVIARIFPLDFPLAATSVATHQVGRPPLITRFGGFSLGLTGLVGDT